MFNKKRQQLLATICAKHSILDVWKSSDYASDHVSCFVMVVGMIHRKADICQVDYSIHSKLRIFCYSEIPHGSTTFKQKRLKEVKEEWSAIQFDVFVLYFIFFVLMSQTINAINRSGACYFLNTSS